MRRDRVVALATAAAAATLGSVVLAVPASGAGTVNYAALGDSYSSGVGTREYIQDSGDCLRSTHAYPELWKKTHHVSSYAFVACSGAKTSDLTANQLGALSSTTSLVTLSIGGNDVGFTSTIRDCLSGTDSTCDTAVSEAETRIRTELPGKLDSAYAQIRKAAPKAKIVVVGYPRLNDETGGCGIPFYTEAKRARINDGGDVLAGVISAHAKKAGFTFADTRGRFDDHGVCSDHEWINGPSDPLRESFHPNVDGHQKGFLPVVNTITG